MKNCFLCENNSCSLAGLDGAWGDGCIEDYKDFEDNPISEQERMAWEQEEEEEEIFERKQGKEKEQWLRNHTL